MITLNLISPEQKQELKLKKIYLTIKEIVMLILFFTLFIAIVLLASKYILEQQLVYLIEKNAATIQINQETNKGIITLNKKISNIAGIQKKFKKWSVFFSRLAQITPQNIAYNQLKIYQNEGILELEGVAKTRADLLTLQKNLENSELFEKINLPLENLLAKEKNIFRIQAEINLINLP